MGKAPNQVPVICKVCKKQFTCKASKVQTYCSMACRLQEREKKREARACPICAAELVSLPGKPRRYCSVACRGLGRRNRVEATCPQCGKAFTKKSSKAGPYCTRICQRAFQAEHQQKTAQCLECGKSFTRKKSMRTDYCTAKCFHQSRQKHQIVTSTCATCRQEFTYSLSRHGLRRYCTRACYARATWEGKSFVSACEHCGKEFCNSTYRPRKYCADQCYYDSKAAAYTIKPCPYCRRDFRCYATWPLLHCSRKCQRLNQQRDLLWKEDMGLINRGTERRNYGPTWRDAQALARARDKVCVDCGISPENLGRELSVHHVTPFNWFGLRRHQEANTLSNLASLCNRCHALKEGWLG